MSEKNYFIELNNINVNDHTETKNGLTYLSWSWAWTEIKKRYPLSFYTIYENNEGWNYFNDGRTGWVKTGVTIVFDDEKSIEHIEYLPIMNFKNQSIKLAEITSFDVNKSIQRSLTKAVARHGLGLYVYQGEDLPEDESRIAKPTTPPPTRTSITKDQMEAKPSVEKLNNTMTTGLSTSELVNIFKEHFEHLSSLIDSNNITNYLCKTLTVETLEIDKLNNAQLVSGIKILDGIANKKGTKFGE